MKMQLDAQQKAVDQLIANTRWVWAKTFFRKALSLYLLWVRSLCCSLLMSLSLSWRHPGVGVLSWLQPGLRGSTACLSCRVAQPGTAPSNKRRCRAWFAGRVAPYYLTGLPLLMSVGQVGSTSQRWRQLP